MNLTELIKKLEPIVEFKNQFKYIKNNLDEIYYEGVKNTVQSLDSFMPSLYENPHPSQHKLYLKLKELLDIK